ncbi:Uncharacterized protein HZ326_14540 [Fusarium oxysporum f. sp. albedinis]|nr:Uncharacterized protein HZ326_14540 [Fusarium oxysporum f. sp. albedinis]
MVLSINWHASQKIPNAIATLSTTWSTSNGAYRPGQWGFAIADTAYSAGSEEQFQHALHLIWLRLATDRVKSLGLDHIPMEANTRPNLDFIRRYLNNILEDK